MSNQNTDIIRQLERGILSLQGLKRLATDNDIHLGFKPIENAFPNSTFPIGCMHEFISGSAYDAAAAIGFASCLLSRLMNLGGVCIWISTARKIFPPALKNFAVEPEQIIFIDLKNNRDVLYATEDALKCKKVTAVISDIQQISFKESRRFQLAAEQSRVTGFIMRHTAPIINTIACVSRWHITSLASELDDGMPGVGFPAWQVELLKVKNGTPGKWNIEWSQNTFKEIKEDYEITEYKHLLKVI